MWDCDPQVLNLRDYKSGSVATINNVEDGANLYLASKDDNVLLKNVQIETGGMKYT